MAVKVVQVLAGRAQGGAELFYERLVIGLDAFVPQVAVVRPEGDRVEKLERAGVPTYRARFAARWIDRVTARRIKQVMKVHDAPLAITWMSRATQHTRPGPYQIAARLGGFYPMRNFRHCDHFIAITQGIADHIAGSGVARDRIHVIGNFIDETNVPPVPRAAHGTPEDVPLVFTCGRLHVNKGFDVFLNALAALPRVHAWIAGDGPLRDELQSQATRLGLADRVTFLGWQSSVNGYLQTADIFVCPSRHEPHGSIVLEAWAHRCPILATDTHGPRELIEPDVTGVLCKNENAASMAAGMRRMLNDEVLLENLAGAAAEDYQRRFASAHILARYREFITTVLKSGAGPS